MRLTNLIELRYGSGRRDRFEFEHNRLSFYINFPNIIQREDYFLPSELRLPDGLLLPMTKKQYDIVLHTVKSIRDYGGQFEILLKVKQADDNPQFDFLNPDSEIHEFYQHVCHLRTIKLK